MSTRIRTVKPAWLDDVKVAESSSDARVLSIALIVMSDDYGNGRLGRAVKARVFPVDPSLFDAAFEELVAIGFVRRYVIEGEEYFHVNKWDRHQRVDRPGKPGVPGPEDDIRETVARDRVDDASPRETVAKDRVTPATDWKGKERKGEEPPNPQTGPEPTQAPAQAATPRPLADPELLTTFRSALAAAGHGNKFPGSNWRTLSEQWGAWTLGMPDQERHDLLRRAVARWAETGEVPKSKWPVSVFLTWAGDQEGIGKPKPDIPEHRPAPAVYQLTDADRAAQADTGNVLLGLLEAP